MDSPSLHKQTTKEHSEAYNKCPDVYLENKKVLNFDILLINKISLLYYTKPKFPNDTKNRGPDIRGLKNNNKQTNKTKQKQNKTKNK